MNQTQTFSPMNKTNLPHTTIPDAGAKRVMLSPRLTRAALLTATLFLVRYSLSRRSRRRSVLGKAVALASTAALVRSLNLKLPAPGFVRSKGESKLAPVSVARAVRVESAVTMNVPRDQVFQFFRKFENFPKFMRHIKEVKILDEVNRSHWVAEAILGTTVEWEAEITEEIPEELISWRSTQESEIPNMGTVSFREAPRDQGTEVRVLLQFDPPAGKLGNTVAKMFGKNPQHTIRNDLHRLKSLLETGEIPTIAGQSSARAIVRRLIFRN